MDSQKHDKHGRGTDIRTCQELNGVSTASGFDRDDSANPDDADRAIQAELRP
jgi:hypothetical protein